MKPRKAKQVIQDVKQFSRDGCSYVPNFKFLDCCLLHDYYYVTNEISRREADKKLYDCIKNEGYPILAWIYWLGVRLLGKDAYESDKDL